MGKTVNKGAINKDPRVVEAKCCNMERQGWSPEDRLFPVHGHWAEPSVMRNEKNILG